MKTLKYPMNYEAWCKLASTKKAMKIIMNDYYNHNQLTLELQLWEENNI